MMCLGRWEPRSPPFRRCSGFLLERDAEVVKARCVFAGTRNTVARCPENNWQRGCMIATAAGDSDVAKVLGWMAAQRRSAARNLSRWRNASVRPVAVALRLRRRTGALPTTHHTNDDNHTYSRQSILGRLHIRTGVGPFESRHGL